MPFWIDPQIINPTKNNPLYGIVKLIIAIVILLGKINTEYHFVPSPGVHFFWYKRTLIRAERSR